MSKHTPGPWRYMTVEGSEHMSKIITPYMGAAVVNTENAILIAAAPDLLEALKDLTNQLRNSRFKMDVKKDFSLMVAEAAASKAIAKAEGQ